MAKIFDFQEPVLSFSFKTQPTFTSFEPGEQGLRLRGRAPVNCLKIKEKGERRA